MWGQMTQMVNCQTWKLVSLEKSKRWNALSPWAFSHTETGAVLTVLMPMLSSKNTLNKVAANLTLASKTDKITFFSFSQALTIVQPHSISIFYLDACKPLRREQVMDWCLKELPHDFLSIPISSSFVLGFVILSWWYNRSCALALHFVSSLPHPPLPPPLCLFSLTHCHVSLEKVKQQQ